MIIEILGIFFAGILSFLSPCVLPLVPPYLCYMTGASIAELTGNEENQSQEEYKLLQRRLIINSLFFVLGFTVVFVSLGASASSIGKLLNWYKEDIAKVAGVLIILMGLHFLGVFKFSFLQREARFQTNSTAGSLGSFVMGLAFAFGWSPCIGPILSPVLGLAGAKDTVLQGASLLLIYSVGLGVPFILAAFYVGNFMAFSKVFKKHLGKVEKFLGVMLIITGMMFLTGGMQSLSTWMLNAFPLLGKLG